METSLLGLTANSRQLTVNCERTSEARTRSAVSRQLSASCLLPPVLV
jgi:hypothetical protein